MCNGNPPHNTLITEVMTHYVDRKQFRIHYIHFACTTIVTCTATAARSKLTLYKLAEDVRLMVKLIFSNPSYRMTVTSCLHIY
jgi:hypothetical protein